jgi:endonuclease V-like protein UPF0215 family
VPLQLAQKSYKSLPVTTAAAAVHSRRDAVSYASNRLIRCNGSLQTGLPSQRAEQTTRTDLPVIYLKNLALSGFNWLLGS